MKTLTLLLVITTLAATGQNCKQIKKSFDELENRTEYRSPYKPIYFVKYLTLKDTTTYLCVKAIGYTPSLGKGFTLILEDGSKIEKPEVENDVSVNANAQYVHQVFVRLEYEDIEKLKRSNIRMGKIYIYDFMVLRPEKYKNYINCIDNL